MTAFLLTWKETGWPHENIVRMVRTVAEKGYVDEPWRLAAHNMAKPGDIVWVLKQGRGAKGFFGRGRVTAGAVQGEAGNGKIQWMAPVRFDLFVDPKEQLLIGEVETVRILRATQVAAQASGYPLDDEQSDALEAALQNPPIKLAGGGDWTAAELNAIVSDYFAMLAKETVGEAYSKTAHRKALMTSIHRSPGSIERKHQNISAVLMELSLPWINGYKPLGNFQDALLRAVETKLDQDGAHIESATIPPDHSDILDPSAVIVPAPEAVGNVTSASLRRLVRKYDPAARDAANRALGEKGEDFVRRLEIERLIGLGRADLAAQVKWVSRLVGDGLGYDIESFDADGLRIFIEVKSTRGPIRTPFYISSNELRVAAKLGPAFRLYRVFSFGNETKAYLLAGPLEATLRLEPVSYRARIGGETMPVDSGERVSESAPAGESEVPAV